MSDRIERVVNFFNEHLDQLVETIEHMASVETPSRDRARLDAFADYFAERLRSHCDKVSVVAGRMGARIRAEVGSGDRTLLVLGHMDTVWPAGAARKPELTRDGDKLFGPGVFDMKGGLGLALFACKAIKELEIGDEGRRVVLLFTPDEEAGSVSSREAIEREAEMADAVLVLEPPLEGGKIKLRRKGCGRFRIEVFGREAHAGINPGEGVNAVHELAAQVMRLVEMGDPERGVTMNVGVIEGGTKENVIPGFARATLEFRAMTHADLQEIADRIRNLTPFIAGARLEISGGIERPPMEETPESRALAELAQDIARQLGFELEAGLSGGSSDGSLTAALGLPTLDGLGAEGSGAHMLDEHISISALVRRGALITELMLRM